jgi:hypothetical protein
MLSPVVRLQRKIMIPRRCDLAALTRWLGRTIAIRGIGRKTGSRARPGLVSTEVDFGRRLAGSHAGFEVPFYLALNGIAYRN